MEINDALEQESHSQNKRKSLDESKNETEYSKKNKITSKTEDNKYNKKSIKQTSGNLSLKKKSLYDFHKKEATEKDMPETKTGKNFNIISDIGEIFGKNCEEQKEFKMFEKNSLNKGYYTKNKDINKNRINENLEYKDYKIINQRNYIGLCYVNNIFFYFRLLMSLISRHKIYEPKIKDKNLSYIEINVKNQNNKKIEYKRNKKVQNIIGKVIKPRINIMITLLLYISLQKSVNKKYNLFESKFSKITLKIKGIGYGNILSNKNIQYHFNESLYPDNVYINEIKQDIVNYSYYFNQTDNFVELVWNKTINSCQHMFKGCTSITEIDLSYFDSSQLRSTHAMFYRCNLLTSINFSNFDTSKVTDMYGMFCSCSSLLSLDLSNFDTSIVYRSTISSGMEIMFAGCTSLTSLNLSNFNTSRVVRMFEMFKDCKSLKYINLQNFNEISLQNYNNMFKNVPNDFVVCINKNITSEKIFPQIKTKICYTIDCSDDWKSKQKRYIDMNNICKDNCKNNSKNKDEYNEECYQKCIEESTIINKSQCELDNCLIFPEDDLNKKICTKCNTNYHQIENEPKIIGTYINCYKDLKGYYLDENDSLYKKCYYTCEECDTKGDNIAHNCLKCNLNYSFEIKLFNYTNCYENCSYYYYFNDSNSLNIYYCTNNYSCPREYPILLKDKRQCIKNNIRNIIQEIFSYEKNETNERDTEEEIKYYDKIIEQIESIFTSENYDTSNLDNGKDETIKTEKMTITFTTTQNQKNNINNNITTIELGECETLLKKYYNISDDELLYIKKIDVNQEGMKISKTEYDVYSKLSGASFINLNLSVCKNSKISLSVPIIITENIDILNSSSGYYNDICYTAKSDSGTDISLNDRKNEFIKGNKTVCQEGCIFVEYNYNTQKANCSCKVKGSSSSIANMNININKLYENLINTKNLMNFKLMICYKILFSKNGIIYNILFFSIIPIIIFHLLTIIIFYKFQKFLINEKINDISYGIQNLDLVKENDKKEIKKNKKKKKKKKKKKTIRKNTKIINQNIINTINNIENNIQIPALNDNYDKLKLEEIQNLPIKKRKTIVHKEENEEKMKKKSSIISMINENIKNEEIITKCKKIMEYNDEEINTLDYELALKYDKRTYCQYYTSLLKTKHIFIYTFYNNNDYNSKIIKYDLFFINFAIFYTVNALFFNDDTMHKIYVDQGSYNFIYQLPQIICSSLISGVLNALFKFLALSQSNILNLKKIKVKSDLDKKINDLNNKLEIKWISFFILSFILLLFFWYYLSAFGAIYRYTQIHLIKDTLISFGLSLIYPFGIYLLPGLFRIPSLSNINNKKSYCYKISLIIQMI